MLSILFRTSLILSCLFSCHIVNGLIIGTYNSPPFSMYEDNELLGLATEVVKDLLKEADLDKETILEFPLARGLAELKMGNIDILYPYVSDLSKGYRDFTLIGPISKYRVSVFARNDYAGSLSLSSLQDSTLSVERRGIANQMLVKRGIAVETTSDKLSCINMVLAKRVVGCATDTLAGMYTAAINNVYTQLRHEQTDIYADMYIALSPKLGDDIVDKLKKAYAKLDKQNYFVLKQQDYEKKFTVFINSLALL